MAWEHALLQAAEGVAVERQRLEDAYREGSVGGGGDGGGDGEVGGGRGAVEEAQGLAHLGRERRDVGLHLIGLLDDMRELVVGGGRRPIGSASVSSARVSVSMR